MQVKNRSSFPKFLRGISVLIYLYLMIYLLLIFLEYLQFHLYCSLIVCDYSMHVVHGVLCREKSEKKKMLKFISKPVLKCSRNYTEVKYIIIIWG